jgi:hypothetical protein
VNSQPSCAIGAVGMYYDLTAGGLRTCGMPSSPATLGNSPAGACVTDIYHGSFAPFDVEFVPPQSTGGNCSTPGVATGPLTFSARDRVCSPTSAQGAGCIGNVCTPALSGGYFACIMQSASGASAPACPPGPLSVQRTVGSGPSVTCSNCGCSVSARCTGTVTVYSNSGCTQDPVAVPADGNCYGFVTLGGTSTAVASYTYTGGAPSSVGCAATGTSSAQSVVLNGLATVCCSQ